MTPEREKKLMRAKKALAGDMRKWCDKYDLTDREALALCAYVTGAAIAMQDQRITTSKLAMEIVLRNIEAGNASVIDQLSCTSGHAN